MSDDEAREEKELDLTSPDVVTKYKSAAEIVNSSVSDLLYDILPPIWCFPSASPKPRSLIFASTATLLSGSGGHVYTCSLPPVLLCFFSDMGCHIDGFIAVVGHTHVIQEGPVSGRTADVISAANTAAEVALRLVRPGKKVSGIWSKKGDAPDDAAESEPKDSASNSTVAA
ncbi:hypothetical protein GW17_00047400 [Ensete ventricosum]|nr:hypothetical protein GW17_00047400 [Ensete ventricosum]